MADFTLSSVTIPTPAPYDDKYPSKQLENLCYVLLQVVQIARGAAFKFGDVDEATKDGTDIKTAITNLSLSVPPADMTALTQAVKDLRLTDAVIDFGFCRVYLSGQIEYI